MACLVKTQCKEKLQWQIQAIRPVVKVFYRRIKVIPLFEKHFNLYVSIVFLPLLVLIKDIIHKQYLLKLNRLNKHISQLLNIFVNNKIIS